MIVLYVFLALILALALLSLVRVETRVRWDDQGLRVHVRVGPVEIQVYPISKAPKKKPPRPAPEKQASAPSGKKDWRGLADLLGQLLPLGVQAAGELREKIVIRRLYFHVVWAAADPATAALGYGRICAGLGMLWPVLEHNFHIRERDVGAQVSFAQTAPTAQLDLRASLRIGQGVSLGLRVGVKALSLYLKHKKEHKKDNEQKAVQQV